MEHQQNITLSQSTTVFDKTGQCAPPGMKPRVVATLWEEEGTLNFTVDVDGVRVTRREDNHFINCTALLKCAGATAWALDQLKERNTKHIIKSDDRFLQGIWLPFEQALDLANTYGVTDSLYPLFVHNIGGLLYQPPVDQYQMHSMEAEQRKNMCLYDIGGR